MTAETFGDRLTAAYLTDRRRLLLTADKYVRVYGLYLLPVEAEDLLQLAYLRLWRDFQGDQHQFAPSAAILTREIFRQAMGARRALNAKKKWETLIGLEVYYGVGWGARLRPHRLLSVDASNVRNRGKMVNPTCDDIPTSPAAERFLEAAAAHLAPADLKLLRLAYLAEIPPAALARRLRIPKDRVNARLRRARRTLAARLTIDLLLQ